ncbi:heptaprenylglyceryl phosphate synthase [Salisediminibacterium halotolerans]|uniref:Heptaprenylglyceryl phosphate synthase n=1 Tax=Salisediminibacterium halotolerans TaxID=517425 RepID=A0A1H9VWD7_9BACI|nr:heptaprenylglyceryl phosphate synthase [Salisediminibacterium haloalkalitolerans]SES25613.1 putative glycerol-1-phosphate prenyltransferase [Salisediminibacterium haloalkalitolerans]
MKPYYEWRHVFKLDPAKPLSDDALEQLAESGTDAIIIGGSGGVTEENTLDLLMRVRQYSVTCALEVSTIQALSPGFDYYLIPSVLNAAEVTWLNGLHHRALKEYGHMMPFQEVLSEGYCVLNEDSTVAQLTGANTHLDTEDVVAYARMTDQLFHMPIFYLEYSGTYGCPETVDEVNRTLEQSQLFYGGGIATPEQAEEMAASADTIVVGNVIYDDLKNALKTVGAVKTYA